MANLKSLRVIVLAAPKERKLWYKAARKAAVSLAEYMRQAANEKLARNEPDCVSTDSTDAAS